ncbi:MAG: nucleotide exchange factor GrpE, partial [Mycobacteriales bacterium]
GSTRVMPALGADGPQSVGDRSALIRSLIHLADRATSSGIGDHIDATLREVGVTEDSPVGQRFDPARHEAGGFEPAPDAGSRDIITGVEIMGYHDRDGSVLRPPVVTVYR